MFRKLFPMSMHTFGSMNILSENHEPSLSILAKSILFQQVCLVFALVVYDVIECGNLSAVVSAARGSHLHTTRWSFHAPASPLIKFELRHLLLLGYPHCVGPAQQQQRLFALHIQVQRGMLYLLHAPCCRTGLHAMPPCLHYNIHNTRASEYVCVCDIHVRGGNHSGMV
jgi:hypothetical protein